MNKIEISDYLHENLQLQDYIFIKDIILLLCIYLFYINFPYENFIKVLKIFIVVIIVRYILSLLTTYKFANENEKEKYFQYNFHIALLYILILSALHYQKSNNIDNYFYLFHFLLLLYILLNIGNQSIYTTDAIFTLAVTNLLYQYLQEFFN